MIDQRAINLSMVLKQLTCFTGLVFGEMKSLYAGGLMEYITDLWNIVDCISNTFYVTWIGLRFTSWYLVQVEHSVVVWRPIFFKKKKIVYRIQRDAAIGLNPWYPREQWDPFDPMLLSEGVFAAGMIFSFLKLVHIFSINPHLGPLQVSLGSIYFIFKIFFLFLSTKYISCRSHDYRYHQILFYLHTCTVCIWMWYGIFYVEFFFYFNKFTNHNF